MEPKEAWDEVGERLRELGEELRQHYGDSGEDDEPAPERVGESLDTLIRAADRLAASAGEAMRDDEVRERARVALRALAEALEVTFAELGSRLRQDEESPGEDG